MATNGTAAAAVAATAAAPNGTETTLPTEKVRAMIDACATGNLSIIQQLVNQESSLYVCQQDLETGISPLMAAAKSGNVQLCQQLLDQGAPWNAIDRYGRCAGNYATDAQHWDVVNLLVEWGTRAELILGQLQRMGGNVGGGTTPPPPPSTPTTPSGAAAAAASNNNNIQGSSTVNSIPVEHQPSTKPDYLRHQLRYNPDGTALLDEDNDAVMMEWERPIMKAHASILMESGKRRVLNVGFGMGIIDGALQEYHPTLHIIIEAHPDVYKKMIQDGWDKKSNVQICFGKWQDVLPELIRSNVEVDAIFYDTYGEHAFDMEDFHIQMSHILSKPQGVYSFFNGLAPDNLFFHGVACQVIKCQLSKIGFDSEFLQCQIEAKKKDDDDDTNNNDEKVWDGIRRKYWHGRDVYYLPRITWNQEFLGRKTKVRPSSTTTTTTAPAASLNQQQQQQQPGQQGQQQQQNPQGEDSTMMDDTTSTAMTMNDDEYQQPNIFKRQRR